MNGCQICRFDFVPPLFFYVYKLEIGYTAQDDTKRTITILSLANLMQLNSRRSESPAVKQALGYSGLVFRVDRGYCMFATTSLRPEE